MNVDKCLDYALKVNSIYVLTHVIKKLRRYSDVCNNTLYITTKLSSENISQLSNRVINTNYTLLIGRLNMTGSLYIDVSV